MVLVAEEDSAHLRSDQKAAAARQGFARGFCVLSSAPKPAGSAIHGLAGIAVSPPAQVDYPGE